MESREALDLNFNRYAIALHRSWIPATGVFLVTALLAALYAVRQKPAYEADAKLLFRLDNATAMTGLDNEADPGTLKSLLMDQSPLNSEIEVLTSRPLLQKTIETLDLRDARGELLLTEDLKKRLNVKIVGAADVVQITYETGDAEEAASVVNTLTNLYIQGNTANTQSDASSAREFIESQLPQTELGVRRAEADLRSFRERNKVVALDNEAASAVEVLQTLDNQIMDAQSALEESTSKAESLRGQLGLGAQEAIAVSSLSQSPAVQSILTDLQDIQRQLATESPRFTGSSPVVIRLQEKETSLRRLLQDEVSSILGAPSQVPEGLLQLGTLKQDLVKEYLDAEVQRLSVGRRLVSLQDSRAVYQQRVNVLPRLEQEQRELERRLKAAQGTYETLLTKLQELQVRARQATNNVRIIEPAVVPTTPLMSQKLKIMAIGLIIATLLAATIVVLQDLSEAANRRPMLADGLGGKTRDERETTKV